MTKLSLWLLIFTAYTGFGTWWCVTNNHTTSSTKATQKKSVKKTKKEKNKSTAVKLPLEFIDGDDFQLSYPENLEFSYSSGDYLRPLSDSLVMQYRKLASYLKERPDKKIFLNGLYRNDEQNNSPYDNLGLGRASAIKDLLLGMGVPKSQIQTEGLPDDELVFSKSNILSGGISYTFVTDKTKAKPSLADIETRLRAKSRNVYFEYKKTRIIMDDELANYFKELKYYLDEKPGAKIKLIGHTDDIGASKTNYAYGRSRARYLREYMLEEGFTNSQIEISSKGEKSPIATNKTEEGRQENRRVEILVP